MISLPSQVLELNGPDAVTFAHAQFCNDVLGLPDANWQWNAWLSPQGRVRTFFCLHRANAAHLTLTLRGGDAQWMHAELTRFVFRAKVQMGVAAGTSKTTALADIRAGIPEVGVELRDQLLPQWLGLDRLGAVSVRKGCYPGQEIMARLHFKGGNKRSLYRLRWRAGAAVPAGTALRDSAGVESGVIVMAAHDTQAGYIEALASLPGSVAEGQLRLEQSPERAVEILERFA